MLNTVHEPTLLDDIGATFDRVFSASLRDTADERAKWLPLPNTERTSVTAPPGLSLLTDDPRPPEHSEIEAALRAIAPDLGSVSIPVVVVLGNGGRMHSLLIDCLRSGAAVVSDSEIDLRGIAHVGEHLDVFPSKERFGEFLTSLWKDSERLSRLSARGPAIVDHLHQPQMRARRICDDLWPTLRIFSGLEHRPRISVLVTCHRYLKRFRVCLESLARQVLPAGSLEIVVSDPGSPDGLANTLEDFGRRHPELRVVHLPLDPRYHRNRGVGINRAFEVSSGQIIIAIDADIIFPPQTIAALARQVEASPGEVIGVRRTFLPRDVTEGILSNDIDPFASFDKLSQIDGDGEEHPFVGVLGYCQAVHRSAFARARYPEEFDMVNQSDIVFVERLAQWAGVRPRIVAEQNVLHLWHPRNWSGTTEQL